MLKVDSSLLRSSRLCRIAREFVAYPAIVYHALLKMVTFTGQLSV